MRTLGHNQVMPFNLRQYLKVFMSITIEIAHGIHSGQWYYDEN